MRWALAVLLLVLIVTGDAEDAKKKKKKSKRIRSLPSVSDHHYSELFRDGSYKFAYTGDRRYHTELRTRDGLVEGETVHIRPDGVPIKVHYFADKNGYRPHTEVLYTEKETIIPDPDVVFVHPGGGQGRGDFGGGDTAVASPSVTAIVGPGAVAITTPQISATAGHGATGSPNYPNPVSAEELARILKIIAESRDKGSHSGSSGSSGTRTGKYYHVPREHVYVYPPVDEWATRHRGGAPSYSYSYGYALPGQNTYKDTTGYVSVKVNSN